MTADTEQDGFITVHPAPKITAPTSWHVGAASLRIYQSGDLIAEIPRKAYEQLAADVTAQIAQGVRR